MNMDLELPGGVITTHCVSSVIRPGSKVTHDPLQFVKIQSAELSKKAVEQIRLAEEVKITKDKIKEVEEEWQNNLLNWKSKRRQSRTTTNCSLTDTEGDHDNEDDDHHHLSHRHHHLSHHLSHHHLTHHHHDNMNNRKIKTFSEILNDKAKSGYRIGYNLHKYIRNGSEDDEEEEEDEDEGCKMDDDATSRLSSSSDDSADKKIISQPSSESMESTEPQKPPTTTTTTKHESYSGSFKRIDGGGRDNDEDDGTVHDSVDDSPSSSSSSKLFNGLTINSNGHKKSQLGNDNELIDQQRNDDDGQQSTDKQDHHHQQINLKNSLNVDYQQSNGNKETKKLTLAPSISLPPTQSKLIKPAICKINSYNDTMKSNNSTIGKKVVIKFKIDKDISRQSSLPLLSSSSCSSSSSSTAPCDRETISKRFSSSENEIKEINQENEPRLSFRDKLSNFENLSKGEDVGTSSSSSSTNHLNHYQNLHHSHLQKVRKSTESSASCDKETINSISSSSEVEIINEITVNQENEPRLSFRDKLSNFENLAKGEDLIGSSSTNHPPANPNHFNHHQPHLLSKDRKSTEATSSSSSLSSSSSSSNRISGHPILTSSQSTSSLSNHPSSHLPNHHGEQIKKDQSTTNKLGDKSCSEAQLMMKKSNENLKPNQDQRSMLSISGKKRCSNCGDELGRGCAAMVIETLSLYYHINCFRCSVCHIQLGNGTCGTDVRVRSNRLHCQNCYSNDEVGLTRV